MKKAKVPKKENKFQSAVDYLAEYSHVRGAAVVDHEGLVLTSRGGPDFDAELCGALALELADAVEGYLPRLVHPGFECLTIKTRQDWITIARSVPFFLVVAADRQADELLNIRISRSLEMVSSYIKERYPFVPDVPSKAAGTEQSMEEIHV